MRRCVAAGAAIGAVEEVWSGPAQRRPSVVRPPAQHAEAQGAMGYAAKTRTIAAEAARRWAPSA